MKRSHHLFSLLAAASLALAGTSAFAQATRTWVSGVGDDVNPCSRTAPCKTFAGAISKTATGGLINVLDPGGYGGVTIVKSITIDGASIGHGGVLVSGTNGIVINAPADAVVEIRNLNIIGVGAGTDLAGIKFLAGRSLHVDNVEIQGFDQRGIEFRPSGTSRLVITDSFIHNNVGVSGTGGIWIAPAATGLAEASITGTRATDNGFGLRVDGRSVVAVKNSVFSGNSTFGVVALGTTYGTATPAPAVVSVDGTQLSGNGHDPANVGAGAYVTGAQADIVMSNSDVTHNDMGLRVLSSGNLRSFGNNRVYDNDSTDAFTATLGED